MKSVYAMAGDDPIISEALTLLEKLIRLIPILQHFEQCLDGFGCLFNHWNFNFINNWVCGCCQGHYWSVWKVVLEVLKICEGTSKTTPVSVYRSASSITINFTNNIAHCCIVLVHYRQNRHVLGQRSKGYVWWPISALRCGTLSDTDQERPQ